MITENPFLEKKVLVVTAHPDDEAYFAGTLRQVVESGGEVRLLCGTLGERGRSYLPYECPAEELKQIRYAELCAAANAVGISKIYVGGYPDGALMEYVEAFTAQIERVVFEYNPDIILGYGPDGYTGHADHVAAYTAAFSVARARSLPYVAFTLPPHPHRIELMRLLQAKRKLGVYRACVEAPEPSVVVSVDVEFKVSLLRCHASQLQGLNPYVVFGEVLGGHLMRHEYFRIMS